MERPTDIDTYMLMSIIEYLFQQSAFKFHWDCLTFIDSLRFCYITGIYIYKTVIVIILFSFLGT